MGCACFVVSESVGNTSNFLVCFVSPLVFSEFCGGCVGRRSLTERDGTDGLEWVGTQHGRRESFFCLGCARVGRKMGVVSENGKRTVNLDLGKHTHRIYLKKEIMKER